VTQCIPCEEGKYQPHEGQQSGCLACGTGYVSSVGAFECEGCPRGTFASSTGSTFCQTCLPGSYAREIGSVECSLCPPGTYNPAWGAETPNACINCPVGGSSEYGANSSDTCKECSSGFYLEDSTCIICPPGTYNNDPLAASCTKCPLGTYLAAEGSIFSAQCGLCARGTYSDAPGLSCTLCVRGTYGISIGGKNASVCEPCAAGYSSQEGSQICSQCLAGTYAPHVGYAECLSCPPGTFANNSRLSQCALCEPGSFAEGTGSSFCELCPAGTFNPSNGSTSSHFCVPCPIGTFSNQIGAPSSGACNICPKGAFCDTQGLKKEKKCRAGTYSSVGSAISVLTCQLCPRGTYRSVEGATKLSQCESCQVGTYNEVEGASSISLCVSCTPGTFSTELFATSNVCTPCIPGTYSPFAGAAGCLPCGMGRYNPKFGSSSFQDCISCPIPMTTSTPLASSIDECIKCDEGHFLQSMECHPCPEGTYFDPLAESSDVPTNASCIACGRGFYQPLRGEVGGEVCMDCPVSTFGPSQQNAECTACRRGTFSSLTGSPSESDCAPCPPGTWGESDLALTIENCLPCPPGTFSNVSGANSSLTCQLCPEGYMSLEPASATCTPCLGDTCTLQGSSFEIGASEEDHLLQDETNVYDPKSLQSIVEHYYDTLKYSIPLGLLGLCGCCFCCTVGLFLVGISVCTRCSEWWENMDLLFSNRHHVPVGQPKVRNQTVMGALMSVLVVIAFLVLFTAMILDFIENNKIVLESFVLEDTENVSGQFLFQIFVVGEHKLCDGLIGVHGFAVKDFSSSCEYVTGGAGSQHMDIPETVHGCFCEYQCRNCQPIGGSHHVYFNLSSTEHMMSPSILFRVEVPHYLTSQSYFVNGSMSSGNSIFTGNNLPHKFSFTMNNAKYMSISKTAALYDAVGVQNHQLLSGYTIQLVGKFPGSLQPQDSKFELQKGIHIEIDIDRSSGIVLSKEVTKQTVATFLAQLLTVFSLLIAASTFGFRCFEWICGKRKPSRWMRDNRLANSGPMNGRLPTSASQDEKWPCSPDEALERDKSRANGHSHGKTDFWNKATGKSNLGGSS